MKKWLACVAAMSLAMVGCGGGDACDDVDEANDEVADKAEACRNVIDDSYFEGMSDAELDECKEGLDNCSDGDKDVIKDFADCAKKVPKCSASNTEPFENGLTICLLEAANKLTPACGAAVLGSSLHSPANFSRAR
ncbi:hypothetical protein POL68_36625 [Stigmatella sp. ncwal1]|uniref:Lipoprotein n=1 Tax=Stigmatella ashevillensis TaxID=2995309 RepID=A0ABT5DMT3_9BACT|nr:hypothetical protein [Stigmatella ashevillena]MDC0714048.1 hypothetical protein [Stigmatella ashevillena]